MTSGALGVFEVSLYDVVGKEIGRCRLRKDEAVTVVDLTSELTVIEDLPEGVYFIRVRQGSRSETAKLVLAQ